MTIKNLYGNIGLYKMIIAHGGCYKKMSNMINVDT